jgi:hypothetical protein
MISIPLVTAIGGMLGEVIPQGGKRRQYAAELLRAVQSEMNELSEDLKAAAEAGEDVGPMACRMIGRNIESKASMLGAIADVLKKDDEQ